MFAVLIDAFDFEWLNKKSGNNIGINDLGSQYKTRVEVASSIVDTQVWVLVSLYSYSNKNKITCSIYDL